MRLLALLFLLLVAPAAAQTFPPLSGRVVDAANILPPDVEARITARSAALEQQTGAQAIVATIPDLQGYPIEEYGYRLGRHWQIGQKREAGEGDNGVILLVAPNDRKVRIEVGYGLEPVITDTLASVIIQRSVLPAFRAGDMPGGVEQGFESIVKQLELPPEEAAAAAEAASAEAAAEPEGSMLGGIFFLLFFLFWIWLAFRSARKGRRRGRRAAGPIVIWGPGPTGWGGGWGSGGGWSGGGAGGFGGGGGSFGGGGASGGW